MPDPAFAEPKPGADTTVPETTTTPSQEDDDKKKKKKKKGKDVPTSIQKPTKKDTATENQLERNIKNPTGQLDKLGLEQEAVLIDPDADGTHLQHTTDMNVPVPQNLTAATAGVMKVQQNSVNEVSNLQNGTIDAEGENLANAAELTAEQSNGAMAAEDVLVEDYEVSVIKPDEIASNLSKLRDEEPLVAASVASEMTSLLSSLETGDIPAWAKPAVTQVERQLASRGVSASSIGRDSLFNAIIQSAMPIAQQDAQMKQQTNVASYQAKVQAILSDSSAENAALNFNATSENQKNQFMSSLNAQVDMQNAQRKDAVATFNVSEVNKTEQFNAGQVNAMLQFNANLKTNIEQFNATNALAIEQSNVNWRRQANTANTAIENQVNMTNTQNAFNLNNQALTFMWQKERDDAAWYEQATQNELDRQNRLEATVLGNEAGAAQAKGSLYANILKGLSGVFKASEEINT